jgi:hypothetical protein
MDIIKIIYKKDDVACWKILTFTNVTEIKKVLVNIYLKRDAKGKMKFKRH